MHGEIRKAGYSKDEVPATGFRCCVILFFKATQHNYPSVNQITTLTKKKNSVNLRVSVADTCGQFPGPFFQINFVFSPRPTSAGFFCKKQQFKMG